MFFLSFLSCDLHMQIAWPLPKKKKQKKQKNNNNNNKKKTTKKQNGSPLALCSNTKSLREIIKTLFPISTDDIDQGIIKYVLIDSGDDKTRDGFTFNLLDSKPNRVPGNRFHITWSVLGFEQALYNVTEDSGVVQVPIRRTGNLKQVHVFYFSKSVSHLIKNIYQEYLIFFEGLFSLMHIG